MFFHGHLDAVIAGGQDIGTAEGEHEEHVRGPNAHTFDLGKVLNDLEVGQSGELFKFEEAGLGFCGEVAEIGRLLLRQPDRAHLSVGKSEDAFRRQWVAGGVGEALEDGGCGFAVELLIEDRFGQGVEGGLAGDIAFLVKSS